MQKRMQQNCQRCSQDVIIIPCSYFDVYFYFYFYRRRSVEVVGRGGAPRCMAPDETMSRWKRQRLQRLQRPMVVMLYTHPIT